MNLKELEAAMRAADAKCEGAIKAITEAKEKLASAKDEEKKDVEASIVTLSEALTEAQKEADDLMTQVEAKNEEAKARAKRQATLARLEELAQPEQKQVSSGRLPGDAKDAEQKSEPATARDAVEREYEHVRSFWKFMCDGWEGFDATEGKKAGLLEAKSEVWAKNANSVRGAAARKGFDNNVAVIPATIVAKMLGLGCKIDPMSGKVVMSVDNAVTNPSLANNLVPQEFRPQLIQLPMPTPTLLSRVTVVPCSTGELTYPELTQSDSNEFGGVSFTWGAEAQSKGATEPRFEQKLITCYELQGYTELSERILSRSAINLEALLQMLYRAGMNYEIDRVITNGNGTSQPQGIVGATGVRTVARQVASQVSDDDLVDLQYEVQGYHRQGAVYFPGDAVMQYLSKTYDNEARPLFRPSTAGGAYDRLVGYPWATNYVAPTLGSNGDVIFGNPQHYFLAVEDEVTIARSDHYQFRSNIVAFKVFAVVGGRPISPRAFSYLVGVDGS